MNRYLVTVLLSNGESLSFTRYGLTLQDVAEMESRRNPSASSITVEEG